MNRIAANSKNVLWVVGGLGVTSLKIENNTLTFWLLAQYRLCPTNGDNISSPI